MNRWSIDILRQSGFDLWTWLCVAACLVLVVHAAAARLWASRRGRWALGLVILGVGVTAIICATPILHSPMVGLVWTFILLSLLSTTFYLDLQEQLGTRRMAVLLALRVAALALLVPMLFEPVLHYAAAPVPQRPLILMVDASGSMSFPDVIDGPSRFQSAWQALRGQLPKIYQHFVPRVFTFASDVHELSKPEDLATSVADGKSTDIARALGKALTASGRDDAVVMLISDGADNVSGNVVAAVRDGGRKVCTITVGSEQPQTALPNIAVDQIASDEEFAVGHQGTVTATIKSSSLANRLVDVKMAEIDAEGKATGETQIKQLVLQPLPQGQTAEFSYEPKSAGVHRLAVWIDPILGERTTADNRQEFSVLAVERRIRVLYVEGRLRPEYRYLNRLLGRDRDIETATLLRVRDNRFTAAGEDAGQKLRELPTTPRDWRNFDVIILGDLDSSFLSGDQQAAIEQAVADGAGLMMIGGQNNFGPGRYAATPIEKALPVLVGPADEAQEKSEFIPQLTADGAAHPAMAGLGAWFTGPGGEKAPQPLAALRGNVVVGAAKTGAQVLLVHPAAGATSQIVLAVQRYGKGRSAAFTGDTTYLWYLSQANDAQDNPYDRFWGQLMRWLASENARNGQNGPSLVALSDKSVYRVGEAVRMRAAVRDETGQDTRFAQVKMTLQSSGDGGNAAPPQQVPLAPVESRLGMYEVSVGDSAAGNGVLAAGEYTATLVATNNGKELGRQQIKFTVIPSDKEMLDIAANPTLMKDIADATGGYSSDLDGMAGMVDQLIAADSTNAGANTGAGTGVDGATAQERTVPLVNAVRLMLAAAGSEPRWPSNYDLPMQGLLVAGLLAAEWIFRRKWELP